MFGRGKDQGSQRGYVGFYGGDGRGQQILGDGHSRVPLRIFFQNDAVVASVEARGVGGDGVEQFIFRRAAIGRPVGEEDRGPADSEQAIDKEFGAVVTLVAIFGNALGAYD